jgi:hypothetical protein
MHIAAPKRVAREATDTTWFRRLARCGYAAVGLMHALIGMLAIIVATGGDVASDQTGAMRAIAEVPFGFALLWAIAGALGALALWKVAEGVLVRGDHTVQRWGRRIGQWGQAVVFAALGGIAAAIALGARLSSERAAEQLSRGALQVPGGVFVLLAVGIGVGITGVSFVWMGVRRSYRSQVSVPDGAVGHLVDVLGITGFIAKGVALVAVAVLLLVAGVRNEGGSAGALDGALHTLLQLTLGPTLVALIGAGFIAYAVFCVFRARYARL